MKIIDVAKDFSRYPHGRYKWHGSNSAERLREMIIESLEENDEILIDFNGIAGVGRPFLEEVFGGLERHYFSKLPKDSPRKKIIFKSDDKSLGEAIMEYSNGLANEFNKYSKRI